MTGKPRIVLVAAIARDRTIGRGGKIPWRHPGEQAHFKAVTTGTALVMGRKTFDSIGRVLPGRDTVVVTRDPAAFALARPGVPCAASLDAAIALAAGRGATTVSIAGGADVYAAALPVADEMILSYVPEAGGGDVFFPEFDASEWTETSRESIGAVEVVRFSRRRSRPRRPDGRPGT